LQNCDNRFFSLLRSNGDLGFAFLNVKNRIRRCALLIDNLINLIIGYGSSAVDFGEKYFGIECEHFTALHGSLTAFERVGFLRSSQFLLVEPRLSFASGFVP
jgi:hypothetical protein